ncbi:MAG: tetratricopeptide repeat-containing protein [Chitinophagaceae bacterium]|nr:tetratricopeptide repeat-containing protein [Chitinophagaceae bacterium]
MQLLLTSWDCYEKLKNIKFGLYEKAEPLYIESTAIRKKTVGENHPDYARGLNNMAVLYDLMGQYEIAKMLYVQAIEIRKKTLGENHPDYAYSLINLAATLDNMGEKEQSEQFLLQAREIKKKHWEKDPAILLA